MSLYEFCTCNLTGQYEGFDETQLTSDSGGKGLAVQIIKNFHKR